MEFKHQELTEKVIKAFHVVYNTLGYGFLEKVYENAFVHELGKMQLDVKQQERVDVRYDGILCGCCRGESCSRGIEIEQAVD